MSDASLASTYFLLLGSLLYNEPTGQGVVMLKEQGVFEELPFAADNEQAQQGQQLMCSWLASETTDVLAKAAQSDWLHLLMGIGKVLAPPWASVYLGEEQLLFSEDTLYVRRYYEHYGFRLTKKYQEPDDHIGLELEFIGRLLEQDKHEAACAFTQQFILPWLNQWADDVQKHAKTDYYRALAKLIAGGINSLMQEPLAFMGGAPSNGHHAVRIVPNEGT